jgi:hypothetical protein
MLLKEIELITMIGMLKKRRAVIAKQASVKSDKEHLVLERLIDKLEQERGNKTRVCT